MYKTTLVATDIASGQRVVDELEKIIQVTIALWLYLDEEDEWKLVMYRQKLTGKAP
jgi:hypothetical protein